MKVYQALAQAIEGRSDAKWADIMRGKIYNIMKGAPSGSGIDNGTAFIPGECNKKQLVFYVEYHHMDEYGGYDGWSYHRVIVTHDLTGLNIRITGKNRNGIKDYLSDLYYQWLTKEVNWTTGEYID